MKRQGAGRVLHFAVTGALLGGVGVGCAKHGPLVNTQPAEEPQPEEPLHVNPGPDEDPGAGEPAPDHVNEGPVDEPTTPVIVNTVPTAEPQPEPKPTPTINVAKEPEPEPEPKHVNVRKVPDAKEKK